MATVTDTLIQGLTDRMVQARIDSIDVKPFNFGTLFPVKKVNGFSWKMLTNAAGAKNVAADVHADNGSIIRKKRQLFESAQGDIPFISISREMKRSEIKDYQTAAALAQGGDAIALVDYWGNDVDFCFNGVQAELEFIALKLMSGAGKLAFTSSNNATFAAEFDLDYSVDDDMKKATTTDWGTPATADILGDLATFVRYAKGKNRNPKFAFVSLNTFYKIVSADQIIKKCATLVENSVGVASSPDLKTLNAMLVKQAWLNGLQFVVIDQDITRETIDGTQTTGNPFDDDILVLSDTLVQGSTQYDILNVDNPSIIRAERSHTVVKKYGTIEPTSEVTIGEADAVPVFNNAYKNLYVKTNAVSW